MRVQGAGETEAKKPTKPASVFWNNNSKKQHWQQWQQQRLRVKCTKMGISVAKWAAARLEAARGSGRRQEAGGRRQAAGTWGMWHAK